MCCYLNVQLQGQRVNNTCLWVGHTARIAERRQVYRSLVAKREGKRKLGGPTRRWENNSKIYPQETEGKGVECTDPAPDGNLWKVLLSTVKNLRVP